MQEDPLFSKGPRKVTETDDIISYCYDVTPDSVRDHVNHLKAYIAENGWKLTPAIYELIWNKNCIKEFYTIIYHKVKDKISFAIFQVGYSINTRKNRVYPYKKSIPVLCCSKHLYTFYHKNKPRIMTGTHITYIGWALDKIIGRVFLKVNYYSNVRISYRHFINTNNEWEAMENYFKREIPLELRKIPADYVFYLYNEFFGIRKKNYDIQISLNIKKIEESRSTAVVVV